jgi:hypothetical protein
LVLGWATGKFELTRLTTAWIWWSHHFPPYSILCASPWGPHPNGILSWGSQMGIPKFPKLGLLQLWGPITLCANLRLRWGLKKSCSPHQERSNGMWHATYKQGTRVYSWLLVVGNQTPIWLLTFLLAITFVSKWVMRAHFRHLRFNCFPMI